MNKNNFVLLLLIGIYAFSFISAGCIANLGHPAAAYCTELGYDYEIKETSIGQKGICVIEGEEYGAWDFLNGKVGEEYSYCALNGYEQITKTDGQNPYSREYAVCVLDEREIGQVHELIDLEFKVQDEVIIEKNNFFKENNFFPEVLDVPHSFDWRNYQGINWMTSVKDQGEGCGGCWAFAPLGMVEALHNIKSNNPDLDLDLSEQQLISEDGECCGSCGSCSGGFTDPALIYIEEKGVVDEDCFSFTGSTSPCDLCNGWQSRLKYIDGWGKYLEMEPEEMKQYISEIGPVTGYMGYGEGYGAYWERDIYRCDYDEYGGHVVVFLGYNDTGEYWIAKNSYGVGWEGTDGYFKVGYDECNVGGTVFWADVVYPVLESVVLTPENPLPSQNLICTGDFFYSGQNSFSAAYSFSQNENPPTFTAKANCLPRFPNYFNCVGILPSLFTNSGEEWVCQMGLNGNLVNSNPVIISFS